MSLRSTRMDPSSFSIRNIRLKRALVEAKAILPNKVPSIVCYQTTVISYCWRHFTLLAWRRWKPAPKEVFSSLESHKPHRSGWIGRTSLLDFLSTRRRAEVLPRKRAALRSIAILARQTSTTGHRQVVLVSNS